MFQKAILLALGIILYFTLNDFPLFLDSNKEELTRMVSDNMLRINQDFQLLQNNVTEATCAKVERSIKSDIKRVVLPGR